MTAETPSAFDIRRTTTQTLVGEERPYDGEVVTVAPGKGWYASSVFLGESSVTASILYRNGEGQSSTLRIEGHCRPPEMVRAIADWLPNRVKEAADFELYLLRSELDRVEKALEQARAELALRVEVPLPTTTPASLEEVTA